jgi:hypothetical protein
MTFHIQQGIMQSRVVAPIDYVEQPLEYSAGILKIIGIASVIYGALHVAAGAGTLMSAWILRSSRYMGTTQVNYWMMLGSAVVFVILGTIVILGSLSLLRGGGYQLLVQGLRAFILLFVCGVVVGITFYSDNRTFTSVLVMVCYNAKGFVFPLLVILILRRHRQSLPASAQMIFPAAQKPLPLLRP